MCSMYWTLSAPFTCPECGEAQMGDLQTHFMGEIGSCVNYYAIGQPVEELKGISATLGPEAREDSFTGSCWKCLHWIDFGAVIEDGKVMKVWPVAHRGEDEPWYPVGVVE